MGFVGQPAISVFVIHEDAGSSGDGRVFKTGGLPDQQQWDIGTDPSYRYNGGNQNWTAVPGADIRTAPAIALWRGPATAFVNGRQFWVNGVDQGVGGSGGSQSTMPGGGETIVGGGWNDAYQYGFTGRIAEVLVFNTEIPTVQQIIVQNYLSSKYNLTLGQDEFFAGDTALNGDFDFNLAGIGRDGGAVSVLSGNAGGFVITNVGCLTADGDYLLAAHNLIINDNSTVNLTTTPNATNRMDREWYVDGTNALNTVNVAFDLAKGDVDPMPAGTYYLLARATSAADFTEVATVAYGGAGNVTFNGVNVSALDGQRVTLGATTAFAGTLVIPALTQAPVLYSPISGATNVTVQSPKAAWYQSEPLTDGIRVLLKAGSAPTIADLVGTENPGSGQLGLGILATNTTYYLQVEAFNVTNALQSQVTTFTTALTNPAGAPVPHATSLTLHLDGFDIDGAGDGATGDPGDGNPVATWVDNRVTVAICLSARRRLSIKFPVLTACLPSGFPQTFLNARTSWALLATPVWKSSL